MPDAAQDQPVPGRGKCDFLEVAFQPSKDEAKSPVLGQRIISLPLMGVDRLAARALNDEMRLAADPFDLSTSGDAQFPPPPSWR